MTDSTLLPEQTVLCEDCPFCNSNERLDYLINKVNTLDSRFHSYAISVSNKLDRLTEETKNKKDTQLKKDLFIFALFSIVLIAIY